MFPSKLTQPAPVRLARHQRQPRTGTSSRRTQQRTVATSSKVSNLLSAINGIQSLKILGPVLASDAIVSSLERRPRRPSKDKDDGKEGKLRYRTIFISDIHLGTKGCNAEELLKFLASVSCDQMYLVGDVVDLWEIQDGRLFWPQSHSDVLQKLMKKTRKGMKLIYTPGNHDEAGRNFLKDWPEMRIGDSITIKEEATHVTADGRRFLVLHGDRCDTLVHLRSDLSYALKSAVYRVYQAFNRGIKLVRRATGLPYWSLANEVNKRTAFAREMIDNYEQQLAREARESGYDGVICGHIHQANVREIDGVLYCNDGDWVDSCSALVEHFDGRLEVLRWLEMGGAGARAPEAEAVGELSGR